MNEYPSDVDETLCGGNSIPFEEWIELVEESINKGE